MNGDLISRGGFIMEICGACDGYCDNCGCDCLACDSPSRCDFVRALSAAPAVDAVPVNDEVFGEVLNCAVRYAIESKRNVADTVVIGYITPLIPKLTDKTLLRFEGDVAASQWLGDTGDAEAWKKFRDDVCAERVKRGFEPYRGWWEIEAAKG